MFSSESLTARLVITLCVSLVSFGCKRSEPQAVAENAVLQSGSGMAPPAKGPDLGVPLSAGDELTLDISILPDGRGLPAGGGTVAQGAELFAAKCEGCHGVAGAHGVGQIPQLTGGVGSLRTLSPLKSVNSFWPYAPLVFDYVRRAMPPDAPQSLSADETYALVGYILSVDGIVSRSAKIDKETLANVQMPNRKGFVSVWKPAVAGPAGDRMVR